MQKSGKEFLSLKRLKKRADFLRLRQGAFARPKGFLLQAMPNDCDEIRVGFTASKKLGNAVERNRAKRRMRAVAQDVLGVKGKMGWDYVFIGKRDLTNARNYEDLLKDAHWALRKVHEEASAK